MYLFRQIINKEIEIIIYKQMEILELKCTITDTMPEKCELLLNALKAK